MTLSVTEQPYSIILSSLTSSSAREHGDGSGAGLMPLAAPITSCADPGEGGGAVELFQDPDRPDGVTSRCLP